MARGSLVDVVDHLLDRGVTLQGDSMVTLAGVDLIYLRLNVLLASAETLRRIEAEGAAAGQVQAIALAAGPPTTAPAPVTAMSQPPLATASPAPMEARRTLPPSGGADAPAGIMEPPARRLTFTSAEGASPAEGPSPSEQSTASPTGASRSLAQLIVTLAEFLRQIIERQALRRVEGGGLHDDQIEKIGLALADLERSMKEMRDLFDIEERDLELDLGPLGQIL